MRKFGLREARQHLAVLIDEVKKGREVAITDRGRIVARLAPPLAPEGKGIPDLRAFRAAQLHFSSPLSDVIAADRDDRL